MSTRWGWIALLLTVAAGCRSNRSLPGDSESPAKPHLADERHAGEMIISIRGPQRYLVDGWEFDDGNIDGYIDRRKPGRIIITSVSPGMPYVYAEHLRQKAIADGISQVQIKTVDGDHDD